jgi:hypothetical protein
MDGGNVFQKVRLACGSSFTVELACPLSIIVQPVKMRMWKRVLASCKLGLDLLTPSCTKCNIGVCPAYSALRCRIRWLHQV